MTLDQVKETLDTIGYPVKGPDWEDVLADLHSTYGAQKVGSSINALGDAKPLYVTAGNIAFMVDNKGDLLRACILIKHTLDQRKGAEQVVIPKEQYAFQKGNITNALESEIDQASRVKRSLGIVDTDYQVFVRGFREQVRKGDQIIDDLLSDDKQRNDKAVEAIKSILIIQ